MSKINQSLIEERQAVSFPLLDLSIYIYGSKERYEVFKECYKILNEDPILKNDFSILGRSRIELFKIYAEKAKRFHELFNVTEGNVINLYNHFNNQLPGSLSSFMFLPYIKHLGTDKQVNKWLEPTLRMEVIGAYAQTELGHGSDVRSLETTATFDPKTDEFIVNSPTLTSTKWWPGDLGIVCNHVICMAQLIINEENLGVHGFIVQIRDMDTNKTLPGIEAGDIGEKVGFNTKDNGYLILNNVRIPRENMLMKYSKVNKRGEYERKGNERIGYAIMMQIRNHIAFGAWKVLSQAMVIAIRYSLVRVQFEDDKGVERKILDYQTQQNKLFPLLAATFAMHAGAHKVADMTHENIRRIEEGEDFSMMKDVHATLCGTKAFYSDDMTDGINGARLACGGHGFSSYSGFVTLYREYSPNSTFEGDNTIMALQTARYLIGCLQKARKGGKLQENVDYLRNFNETLSIKQCQITNSKELTLDALSDILKVNATQLIYGAGMALMEGAKEGSVKDSWDKKAGIQLVEAARGHMFYYTFRAFYERIMGSKMGETLRVALGKLCALYAIEKLLAYPLGLAESGYLSPKQLRILGERKMGLLGEIRKDAIGFVDAWDYPDNTLQSALGVYDGNVYERLMDMVRNDNDWNKHDWSETWEKNIKALRYIQRPKPKL